MRCRICALFISDWTILCNPITNHLFLLQVSRLYSSQVVDIVRHIHRPIRQGHEVSIGLVKVLPLKFPAISNGTKRNGTDMVGITRRTREMDTDTVPCSMLPYLAVFFTFPEKSCKVQGDCEQCVICHASVLIPSWSFAALHRSIDGEGRCSRI